MLNVSGTPRPLRPRTIAVLILLLALPALVPALRAADCNRNGISDATDVLTGRSRDCNGNGIPDECDITEASFGFAPPESYPIGFNSEAIVTADLNGDRFPDLVVANPSSPGSQGKSVFVFPNNGKGRFGEIQVLSTGTTPKALAVADLDSDGDLDLLSANHGSRDFSLLFNGGDGNFARALNVPLPGRPSLLVAGDFDGDHWSDLAVAFEGATRVMVLRNRRDRTFQPGAEGDLGLTPAALIGGDFDGDGALDLAAPGAGSNLVTVIHNAGDGSFSETEIIPVYPGPVSLAASDFDLDGDLDLAAGSSLEKQVWLIVNGGKGAFEELFEIPTRTVAENLTAGDFDGDGSPDLTLVKQYAENMVLLNDRQGGFTDGSSLPSRAISAAASDLDGDGDLDLAMAGINLLLLYNPSSGRFDDWHLIDQLFTTSFFPYALAAADLDADGRLDLAAASGGITSVLLADGRGGLSPQVGYPGRFLPSLQVFDVDGDGEPDLAAGGGASVSLLFNRGQGRFGSGTEILMPGEISFFTAADVDGDGNPDLLAAGRESDVLVSLNNGNGTFIDLGVFRVVANASTLAAADLNGDGHPDLATAYYWYSQGISVLLNAGDGTFGNPRTWDVGGFYGIAAADLDGDGDTDLATSRDVLAEGSLVFQNLGNAMFRNKRIYGVMGNQVLAADLNSDSYPDLVFGSIDLEPLRPPAPVSPFFQMFSLLRNRGPGLTFAAPVFFQTGQATSAFAAGDFDGDGVLDLASGGQPDSTQPSLAGSVSLFLNRTPPPVSKDLDRDRIPDECAGRLFHRGDSNGDGAVDLSDAVTIIDFLFSAGAAPGCRESADADNDGEIDLSDPIGLLGFLFLAGPPPAPPGPAPPCGPDPDPPGSPHFIGCESYDPCPR